jgi:hypothetical protein
MARLVRIRKPSDSVADRYATVLAYLSGASMFSNALLLVCTDACSVEDLNGNERCAGGLAHAQDSIFLRCLTSRRRQMSHAGSMASGR